MEMALGLVIDCSVGLMVGVLLGFLVGMAMGAVLSQKLNYEKVRRSKTEANTAEAAVAERADGENLTGEPIAPEDERRRGGLWPEFVYVSEGGKCAHAHPNCAGLNAARRVRALKGCRFCT